MDLVSFVLTPKKELYSPYSLPLFQKVWDPQELRDISFLKWTYRITFSALIAVTFVVDAIFCHPYRQLISNHTIAKINHDIDLKNRAFLTKATGVAIASIVICGYYYYFRSSENLPPPKSPSLPLPKALSPLLDLAQQKNILPFLNNYYFPLVTLGITATTVGAVVFFQPQKYIENCRVIAFLYAVKAMLAPPSNNGRDPHYQAEEQGVNSSLDMTRIESTQESFPDDKARDKARLENTPPSNNGQDPHHQAEEQGVNSSPDTTRIKSPQESFPDDKAMLAPPSNNNDQDPHHQAEEQSSLDTARIKSTQESFPDDKERLENTLPSNNNSQDPHHQAEEQGVNSSLDMTRIESTQESFQDNVQIEAVRSQKYNCCVFASLGAVKAMLTHTLPYNIEELLIWGEAFYRYNQQLTAENEGMKSPLGKERLLSIQGSFQDHLTNSLPLEPGTYECKYNSNPLLRFSLKQPNDNQLMIYGVENLSDNGIKTPQGDLTLDKFWAFLATTFPPPRWETTLFSIENPKKALISKETSEKFFTNEGKQEINNNPIVPSSYTDLQSKNIEKFQETLLDTFLATYPLVPDTKIKVEFSHNDQHYKFWIIQKENNLFQIENCHKQCEDSFDEFSNYQPVSNQTYSKQELINQLHSLAPDPDQSTQLKAWAIDYLDNNHHGPYVDLNEGFKFICQNSQGFTYNENILIPEDFTSSEGNPFHLLSNQDPYVRVLKQFCEPFIKLNPGEQRGALLQAAEYVYALTVKKETDGTYSIQFFDSHGTNKISSQQPNSTDSSLGAYIMKFTTPSKFIEFLHRIRPNPALDRVYLQPVNSN